MITLNPSLCKHFSLPTRHHSCTSSTPEWGFRGQCYSLPARWSRVSCAAPGALL